MFSPDNCGVLDNPKVHVYLDDARHFLATMPTSYDLIISEPSNLFVSGMVNLYTTEFYGLVRRCLNPGGFFVQWVHYYRAKPEDIKGELGTLRSSFPQVTYWLHEY